ncbi:TE: Gypsy retrotransposon integrase 1, partial [Brachionus plicatilis]
LVINDDTSQNPVDLPDVDNLSQDVVMVKFYVDELKEKRHEVYKCVAQNLTYEVGDLVLLNKPLIKKGQSKKLAPKWEGPFSIVEKSKTKPKRKQVKSRTSKSNGDVGTREVLDGPLPDTIAPEISESSDKQTTNVLEDSLESALESADKDEQYEPNHYLRKQTQQLPKGIRKSLRNRQPVDRYGYNS